MGKHSMPRTNRDERMDVVRVFVTVLLTARQVRRAGLPGWQVEHASYLSSLRVLRQDYAELV